MRPDNALSWQCWEIGQIVPNGLWGFKQVIMDIMLRYTYAQQLGDIGKRFIEKKQQLLSHIKNPKRMP